MDTVPWMSVQCFEGVTTVVVNHDNLKDFPRFMKSIQDEKIGLEQGFFKIRLNEGAMSSTKAEDILKFVQEYFSTPVLDGKKMKLPQIRIQKFFQSPSTCQLFGLNCMNFSTAKERKEFLTSVRCLDTFVNQNTCCIAFGILPSPSYYFSSQSLSESIDALQKHYWEEIAKSPRVLYAAGIPLTDIKFEICPGFSLSTLNTCLDLNPETVPGISYPFLYVGKTHSTFAWHIEDAALFSINYLHFGAPCVWSFVPPRYFKKFVESAHLFDLDKVQVSCKNVLGHKYVIANNEYLAMFGIPTQTVIQTEKEFLVIYPYAAHTGFKTGFNVAQAANFGDESWVPLGILAPTCECFPFQVNLRMNEIIASTVPELFRPYSEGSLPELLNKLKENTYIAELGILPQCASPSIQQARLGGTEDVDDVNTSDGENLVEERSFLGARCMLRCPLKKCKVKYSGGRGKLFRVEKHIKDAHEGKQRLLDHLNWMYPEKQKTGKATSCSKCGTLIRGSEYHMNIHIQRKHSTEDV